ncbi:MULTISPECIES: RNA polymerase alpha subunit C-terminal domain-containing protein [Metabacillus]|uniref:RNA polymerase alpha subunit C-terminal domain-containing protein n=1 Tax=Metabacillus TaxID=2675233 RepID=UPI0004932A58|nr:MULTISPECIES: RNA polymerase alpha subunit C-terminal domain-containing protein [Metabacillus]KEZ50402.1 hypothetical protein AZ46_0206865 [Metabacillus indicus LMG 22858]MDX8291672.1 RNA polymerase alpha subunit C-terminal domain-containing protein [Metabacillus indicus]
MTMADKTLRTCKKGHNYFKSSDCPTCPKCESEREIESDFLSKISAPARRALERNSITSLERLSEYSEPDILKLHGVGPSSIPKLSGALKEAGLSFKKTD